LSFAGFPLKPRARGLSLLLLGRGRCGRESGASMHNRLTSQSPQFAFEGKRHTSSEPSARAWRLVRSRRELLLFLAHGRVEALQLRADGSVFPLRAAADGGGQTLGPRQRPGPFADSLADHVSSLVSICPPEAGARAQLPGTAPN